MTAKNSHGIIAIVRDRQIYKDPQCLKLHVEDFLLLWRIRKGKQVIYKLQNGRALNDSIDLGRFLDGEGLANAVN